VKKNIVLICYIAMILPLLEFGYLVYSSERGGVEGRGVNRGTEAKHDEGI